MREMYWTLANICHGLTIIGCAIATYVLYLSFSNMSVGGGPDFSSVIALSFVIIPYCAGRVFESIAARPPEVDKNSMTPCPACRSYVPKSATKCKHCHTDLLAISD